MIESSKNGNRIFNYNAMGNKILDVIGNLTTGWIFNGSRDPLFTWLSTDEKLEAKKHLIPIESVPGPLPMFGA